MSDPRARSPERYIDFDFTDPACEPALLADLEAGVALSLDEAMDTPHRGEAHTVGLVVE